MLREFGTAGDYNFYCSCPYFYDDNSFYEALFFRKRGHLERLHSEPIRDDLSVTTCDSPCPSTTSELIPACAVRVHGASPLVPIITAPSRCSTIETPTPMLESIQTLAFNNFNSTPQGFLRFFFAIKKT